MGPLPCEVKVNFLKACGIYTENLKSIQIQYYYYYYY